MKPPPDPLIDEIRAIRDEMAREVEGLPFDEALIRMLETSDRAMIELGYGDELERARREARESVDRVAEESPRYGAPDPPNATPAKHDH